MVKSKDKIIGVLAILTMLLSVTGQATYVLLAYESDGWWAFDKLVDRATVIMLIGCIAGIAVDYRIRLMAFATIFYYVIQAYLEVRYILVRDITTDVYNAIIGLFAVMVLVSFLITLYVSRIR